MKAWNTSGYEEMQSQYQYRYGKRLADHLLEQAGIPAGKAADLGCGEGSLTQYLHSLAGDSLTIEGVDLDAGMIELARLKNPRLQFTCMDLLDWAEQAAEGYDLFYSNAVLHWLKSWERLEHLMLALYKRLKPGGYVAFHFSLCENGLALKTFLQQGIEDYLNDKTVTVASSIYTFSGVKRLLERNFNILYAEELRERPFSARPGLSFDWMVKSQPIGHYINENGFKVFTDFLYERWQKSPVELTTHQCTFIAEKNDTFYAR